MTISAELERIAEQAPTVGVATDTWSRARRARRRDRALVAAGLVAFVALAGGTVAWLPSPADPPVSDASSLAVPDHLYAVPARMADRDDDGAWQREEVSDDPTVVERGAAAWVTRDGLPVVVGADDGDYHLLDLRDFTGNDEHLVRELGTPPVALSPDGRRLAYAYAELGADAATPIGSGVRVVHLASGQLRDVAVPGTAVSRIEWSADGRWLGFTGRQPDTWTGDSLGADGGHVIGRVAPRADAATMHPVASDDIGIEINDAGSMILDTGRMETWTGGDIERPHAVLERPLEQRLGVTADGVAVELVGDRTATAAQVALVSAAGPKWTVIEIPPGTGPSLSLATGLMDSGQPAVERPAPQWPSTGHRRLVMIAAGALTLAAVTATLTTLLLRRRRRTG